MSPNYRLLKTLAKSSCGCLRSVATH